MARGAGRAALADRLAAQRLSAVAVVPARDEAATITGVVGPLLDELVTAGVLAEVVVVDDGSEDRTAAVAAAAGARVVPVPAAPHHGGKGAALHVGLAATTADLVVYLDADLRGFDPDVATRLLEPLADDPAAQLVKGSWRRPLGEDPDGGGRVNELVARPLLARLFPHLAWVRQPLAGEYAGRRTCLEALPFCEGWAVDLGLLLDVAAAHGPDAIHQVELGTRLHRNRSLAALRGHADAVLAVALDRAGVPGPPVPARPPLLPR